MDIDTLKVLTDVFGLLSWCERVKVQGNYNELSHNESVGMHAPIAIIAG